MQHLTKYACFFVIFFACVVAKSSYALEVEFPWRIADPKLNRVVNSIGAAGDYGMSFGSGESWGFDFSFGIPFLIKNTFIVEPFFGFNGYFFSETRISSDGPTDGFGRWQYGLGLYFRPLCIYSESSKKAAYPFIGIKTISLAGLGTIGDALDCLYCSDYSEHYEIAFNTYLSLGLLYRIIYAQIDIRLSNNKGLLSADAYDPWGVGATYNRSYGPYTEHLVYFSIGVMYFWPLK